MIHESDVDVRTENAAERGVPFPATWKRELNIGAEEPAVDVEALAHAAVQRAREELSLSDATKLDCRQSSKNRHAHMRARARARACIPEHACNTNQGMSAIAVLR